MEEKSHSLSACCPSDPYCLGRQDVRGVANAKSSLIPRSDLLYKCVLGSEDLVFLNRQMSSVISLVLLSTTDLL